MKTILLTLLSITSICFAESKVVMKAASGRFEITQEYKEDFVETVRFVNPEFPVVKLASNRYPGGYSSSPNEEWLLRTQKTASGESIAILYRVEGNGRVSEVLGFNDSLWDLSDTDSRLKRKELYHTAIASFMWQKKTNHLEITLRGSNQSKSNDDMECQVIYDLSSNSLVIKQKAEPVVAPKL